MKKGDVVALYLPVSPIAVAAMLASARIGTQYCHNRWMDGTEDRTDGCKNGRTDGWTDGWTDG